MPTALGKYAPLVDIGTGSPIVLTNLAGLQTLQVTGDGFEHVNFFTLVPFVNSSTGGTAPTNPPSITGFHLTPTATGGNNVVITGPAGIPGNVLPIDQHQSDKAAKSMAGGGDQRAGGKRVHVYRYECSRSQWLASSSTS